MKKLGTLLVLLAAGMFIAGTTGCGKTDKSPKSPKTPAEESPKTPKTPAE